MSEKSNIHFYEGQPPHECITTYYYLMIISTGFSTKSQIILSRQNCEISKQAIDGALFYFIKHLDLQNGDHTYFESPTHRYIYQPIEDLYIFIITTKDSNVVEDLEVIKLLSQIAQTVTKQSVSEKTIMDKVFDLIFYMDEIVIDGNREPLTMDKLETYIAMDSHEEKVQLMLLKNKEKEEKERRRQIALKLEKERQRKRLDTHFTTLGMHQRTELHTQPERFEHVERHVDLDERILSYQPEPSFTGGMKLSMPKQSKKLADLAMETGFAVKKTPLQSYTSPAEPVHVHSDFQALIQIEETCNGVLDVENDASKLSYQGSLIFTIFDTKIASSTSLQLRIGDNCKFKPKYHPNLDKSKIDGGLVQLKEGAAPFRYNSPSSLIKWRHDTTDQVMPFSISCWPSSDSLETSLSIEIINQDQAELNNVFIEFNCPRTVKTKVNNPDEFNIYYENDLMCWDIGKIALNETKTVAFSVQIDLESLLPFKIKLETSVNYFDIEVVKCFNKETQEEITHNVTKKTIYNLNVDSTN